MIRNKDSPDETDDLDHLKENFFIGLETDDYNQLDEFMASFQEAADISFKDIYYLIGDYYHKTEKDFHKKKEKMLKYLVKDVTLNKRFDSWADLALTQSETVLNDYLENGFNLSTEDQLSDFIRSTNIAVNLFRKSNEAMSKTSSTDQKFVIEYGSFLYQIHSYCSRQLKLVGEFID